MYFLHSVFSTFGSVQRRSVRQRSVRQRSVRQRSVRLRSVRQRLVRQGLVRQHSVRHRSVRQRSVRRRLINESPLGIGCTQGVLAKDPGAVAWMLDTPCSCGQRVLYTARNCCKILSDDLWPGWSSEVPRHITCILQLQRSTNCLLPVMFIECFCFLKQCFKEMCIHSQGL